MLRIAFALLSLANAWWDHGHMMVASGRDIRQSNMLIHVDAVVFGSEDPVLRLKSPGSS